MLLYLYQKFTREMWILQARGTEVKSDFTSGASIVKGTRRGCIRRRLQRQEQAEAQCAGQIDGAGADLAARVQCGRRSPKYLSAENLPPRKEGDQVQDRLRHFLLQLSPPAACICLISTSVTCVVRHCIRHPLKTRHGILNRRERDSLHAAVLL